MSIFYLKYIVDFFHDFFVHNLKCNKVKAIKLLFINLALGLLLPLYFGQPDQSLTCLAVLPLRQLKSTSLY